MELHFHCLEMVGRSSSAVDHFDSLFVCICLHKRRSTFIHDKFLKYDLDEHICKYK
jgi:hypothetical protein